MANNYCESSSLIRIPKEKIKLAESVIQRVENELLDDEEEGYVGYNTEFLEEGLWISSDESVNTDHMEKLVKVLVEELDLEGIFVCSWAYFCDKPRIDEFGGGAFAIKKGLDTIWIDAAIEAYIQMQNKIKKNEQNN